jgi:hypothetical protein
MRFTKLAPVTDRLCTAFLRPFRPPSYRSLNYQGEISSFTCSNMPDVGLKCGGRQLYRMDEMRFDLARFGLSGELIMP